MFLGHSNHKPDFRICFRLLNPVFSLGFSRFFLKEGAKFNREHVMLIFLEHR